MNPKEKKFVYVFCLAVLVISVGYFIYTFVSPCENKGRLTSAIFAFSTLELMMMVRPSRGDHMNNENEKNVTINESKNLFLPLLSLLLVICSLTFFFFMKDTASFTLRIIVIVFMVTAFAILPKNKTQISTVFVLCLLMACFFIKPGMDLTIVGLLGTAVFYVAYLAIRYFRKSGKVDDDHLVDE